MKITGELLKAERIKKNLTVAEVANTLKLSSKIITSIESGDTDELPAKTFIRGFVKSYASLLKLDADLILRQFQEEMGSTQPLPKNPPPMPNQPLQVEEKPAVKKERGSLTQAATTTLDLDKETRKKTIIYISIAVALVGVILIINNTIEKYQKEAVVDKNKIEQIQPINPAASPETAPVSAAAPEPATAAAAATTPTPTTAPIETAEKPKTNALGLPIPKLESAVAKAPVSSAASAPAAAVESTNSFPDDFELSAGKPVELIVEAKKEIEFYYAKGNTKTFTRVKLSPKQIQVIRSPTGLHLKAEDGSALTLILNGVEKGNAGPSNKPVKLTF